MDPNNSPDQSTEEWFNTIQPPAPRNPLPQDNPKRSNKLKFVLIAVSGFVIICAGAAGYVALNIQETPVVSAKCLSNSYYEDFTGKSTEAELPSEDSFYTNSVSFKLGTITYTDETATDTANLIEKIGAYYKKHGEASSIKVTISSDYVEGTTSELSKRRLEALKQSLEKSGVAISAIIVQEPAPISVEPDYAVTEGPTLIRISSSSTCEEK